MAKRVISKASKRRLTFFGTASLVIILCFINSFCYNIYVINDLIEEKKSLERNLIILKEEAKELKLNIDKLSDPEYLADYARENYLYSKDDEYIIQISEEITETAEMIDTIELDIDKTYILLGLIFLIIAIFIYIILKSKKSK